MCRQWAQTGSCQYGEACHFSHCALDSELQTINGGDEIRSQDGAAAAKKGEELANSVSEQHGNEALQKGEAAVDPLLTNCNLSPHSFPSSLMALEALAKEDCEEEEEEEDEILLCVASSSYLRVGET